MDHHRDLEPKDAHRSDRLKLKRSFPPELALMRQGKVVQAIRR